MTFIATSAVHGISLDGNMTNFPLRMYPPSRPSVIKILSNVKRIVFQLGCDEDEAFGFLASIKCPPDFDFCDRMLTGVQDKGNYGWQCGDYDDMPDDGPDHMEHVVGRQGDPNYPTIKNVNSSAVWIWPTPNTEPCRVGSVMWCRYEFL